MKKRLISILLSVLFVVGCTHFEEPLLNQELEAETELQTRSGGGATFERMANPYKLEVMQEVYDSFTINPVELAYSLVCPFFAAGQYTNAATS